MDVKLIRCFIVFVVVSFILGVGSAFNGTTENVDNSTNVHNEGSTTNIAE